MRITNGMTILLVMGHNLLHDTVAFVPLHSTKKHVSHHLPPSQSSNCVKSRPKQRQGVQQRQILSLSKEEKEKEDPSSSSSSSHEDAERFLAKARQLRLEIAATETSSQISETATTTTTSKQAAATAASTTMAAKASPWTVNKNSDYEGEGYRLYIDIGREPGTWMDVRWGASGRRIEFTMDVLFVTSSSVDSDTDTDTTSSSIVASKAVQQDMVQDNFGGISSPVYKLEAASAARLRGGFDRMKCQSGGYRIDKERNDGGSIGGRATVRFFVTVDGTPERDSSNGDVFVPQGCLYFSLPCFGGRVSQLSTKEGPVTVRQIGWNTGWRRNESRIVGTFRAVPIADAQRRDGF